MNYFDTGALIRAARLQLQPEGITRPHSLAEFYGIFTGVGIVISKDGRNFRQTLSPENTVKLARSTFGKLKFEELSARDAFAALETAAKKNITGKSIHDFLHCTAAEKSGCKGVVTLNEKDFKRMTSVKIIHASDKFSV
jgi:predicted nucleic acid-binding protein